MPIETAITRIAEVLGPRLSQSSAVRSQHAQNEAHFKEAQPDAVAFVESTSEVAQVMRICHEEWCPVTAWGAGTALEGQHLPVMGGVTLNMMAMNNILAVNAEDMDAVVQPGVTREELNENLRAAGLFFSVDPGANASMGGMAATRASGTTALRYGTMRDNIRSLEVVLADGRVLRCGGRARKSASGYDLASMFIGSEGTLGVITELTVKLHGIPESTAAASCAFESIEQAVQAVVAAIQVGIPVARMELLDVGYVDVLNERFDLALPSKPHLFLEFHGSELVVQEQAEIVGELAVELGGANFDWKTRAEDRNLLWRARHHAYEAMCSAHPGRHALVTDACVPISQLVDAVESARADIEASSLPGAIIGHVGDGNFHAQLMVRDGSAADLEEAKAMANRIAARSLEAGGTITGEHGIGMGKTHFMEAEHGVGWDVMGELKALLDPGGILNPGKLLRPQAS
jgi:D-lactate dehydrogenase (cytochrome)